MPNRDEGMNGNEEKGKISFFPLASKFKFRVSLCFAS